MANRLKELRIERGLSQEALADAVGTTFQTISRLERGERKMPPEWMDRLAKVLKVRPAALIDSTVVGLPDAEAVSEITDNIDEQALLGLWRALLPEMKTAIFGLIKANVALIRGAPAA